MKKILVPAVIVPALFVLAVLWAAPERKYTGASSCKLCHKAPLQGRQYAIWQESAHARSFASLSTEAAAAIAKDAGIADPAASPYCLNCHAPLADKAPELKAEGVSCEVCHGAGSAYKKLAVMEDRDKAVQSGLAAFPNASAIQASCLACHESAHGTAFDFDKAWAAVKHPVPSR
ncbi:MAG TPA: multiheme c-type cytochrome [Candidatus Aminicenantes bacterium]|nr:multiheme c-type cytochrome [Candidatus Aminicenantes bacterium]HRY65940.1 multiheme c-type cytochrome [Candidatus Aminicenantes bacterium]HRZ72734.1 multiheme c-type cytochrome [Candidatus Aminicenantes bacterium]